jgi:hypothetical protein
MERERTEEKANGWVGPFPRARPFSARSTISVGRLLKWARRYCKGALEALSPQRRKDRGRSRVISPQLAELIERLKRENPHRTGTTLLRELALSSDAPNMLSCQSLGTSRSNASNWCSTLSISSRRRTHGFTSHSNARRSAPLVKNSSPCKAWRIASQFASIRDATASSEHR